MWSGKSLLSDVICFVNQFEIDLIIILLLTAPLLLNAIVRPLLYHIQSSMITHETHLPVCFNIGE